MEFVETVSKTVLIPATKWFMVIAVVTCSLSSQSAVAIQTSCKRSVSQRAVAVKPAKVGESNQVKSSDRSISTIEKKVSLDSEEAETSLVFLPNRVDSLNTFNVPTSAGQLKSKVSEKVVVPDNLSSPVTIGQIPHPTFNQAKAISDVILSVATRKKTTGNTLKNVSVPPSLYLDVVMELQNKNASVMPPGEIPPARVRVTFQLQSGNSAMKQFIFFK